MISGTKTYKSPTLDQFKPMTIPDFFHSFKTALAALEQKITQAKGDEYITRFEDIPLDQQEENRLQNLKCIDAAFFIILLLEEYIKINPKDRQKQDKQKLIILEYRLAIQFRQLNDENAAAVHDAYRLELGSILLNHFAYLSNPKVNFKKTDPLQSTLLDAISDEFREYHDEMLEPLNEYCSKLTNEDGILTRKINALIQECKAIHWASTSTTKESLASLRMRIKEAHEYVFNHCQYPDYIDVLYPNSEDRRPFRHELLAILRFKINDAMKCFNVIGVSVERFNINMELISASHKKETCAIPVFTSTVGEEKEHKRTTPAFDLQSKKLPGLRPRELEILGFVNKTSQAGVLLDYIDAEDQLTKQIRETKDDELKNISLSVLNHCKSLLKDSADDHRAVDELTQVLVMTRVATSKERSLQNINDLKAKADKIKGKPSKKWQLLGGALLALTALLLTPLLLSVVSPAAITALHIPASVVTTAAIIAEKAVEAAGVCLFGSAVSFFVGRRTGLSKTVYQAANNIKPNPALFSP